MFNMIANEKTATGKIEIKSPYQVGYHGGESMFASIVLSIVSTIKYYIFAKSLIK